jgi:hypothetical protein
MGSNISDLFGDGSLVTPAVQATQATQPAQVDAATAPNDAADLFKVPGSLAPVQTTMVADPQVLDAVSFEGVPSDEQVSKMEKAQSAFTDVADKILSSHTAAELGTDMVTQMNSLISAARELAPPTDHKDGFLGHFMAKLHSERDTILSHLQSAKKKIDDITKVMDQSAANKEVMIQQIDGMKSDLMKEFRQNIDAMNATQAWLDAVNKALQQQGLSMTDTGRLHSLQGRLSRMLEFYQNGHTLIQQEGVAMQQNQDDAGAILSQYRMVKTQVISSLKLEAANRLQAIENNRDTQVFDSARTLLSDSMHRTADQMGANMVAVASMNATPMIKTEDLENFVNVIEQAQAQVQQINATADARRKMNGPAQKAIQDKMLKIIAQA